MICMALDFESTGLDVEKDRVIEVGAILYSTNQSRLLESAGYLVQSDVPVIEKITKITGITQAAVNKFGFTSQDAIETLLEMYNLADAIIGQNVIRFDKRLLENWCKRENKILPEKLWIDTMTDLPGVEGKHLGYMAADAHFLNLFPHGASTDCLTVIKLVSMHKIEDVIERAKSPIQILKAHVTYDTNSLAKARKYKWNPENKMWWKVVKTLDLPAETGHGEFEVSFIKDIPVEKLWYAN